MTSSALAALATVNLVGSAALLVVMALRVAVRRLFGARIAYGLWIVAPIAVVAALLSAQTPAEVLAAPAKLAVAQDAVTWTLRAGAAAPRLDLTSLLLAVWGAGVVAYAGWAAIARHAAVARFGHLTPDPDRPSLVRASSAAVGPALLGLVRPRIVVPADFEQRFSPREQDMVLAHERTHLAAGHVWCNAAITLACGLNWFNPVVHIAARAARSDQELACDATVLRTFPNERRTYAEAMMKTQFDRLTDAVACAWPSRSANLLKARLLMLARPAPGRRRALSGAVCVAGLSATLAAAAWAAPAPRVVLTAAPAGLAPPRAAPAAPGSAPTPRTPATPPGAGRPVETTPISEKDAALRAGDWRRAAQSGATAADVVRALQAAGQALGTRPEEAVVTIGADNHVDVVALKPLPPLPAGVAPPDGRTANLGGSGFAFTSGNAIVLYPADAKSFQTSARPARPQGGPLNVTADHLTIDKATQTTRFEGRPIVWGDLTAMQVLVDGAPATAPLDADAANARHFAAVEVRGDDPRYGRTSVNFITAP